MAKTTASVLERVQALYGKDESMKRILAAPTVATKTYTESDGVPLPESNPIRQMTGLPCLPYSKVVQVAGKPDTGKSTCAGEVMAAAQKAGFKVILWDAEDKFDATRFVVEFGGSVAPDNFFPIKTNETRKGGQIVKDIIKILKEDDKDCKILVVWDSVGASISRSEVERNLADEKYGQPGQDAKENGAVIRHFVGTFNQYPDSIAVLLVNQTYAKIGFMQKGDQAKGGSGIEYLSSLILFLKRIKILTRTEKKKKVKTGIVTRATIAKNHLSQGKTSVYQMDFVITAAGSKVSDLEVKDEDSDESQESEE